jgi:hypothetical protein
VRLVARTRLWLIIPFERLQELVEKRCILGWVHLRYFYLLDPL